MSILSFFRGKKRRNADKVVTGSAFGLPSELEMHGLKLGIQDTCVLWVKCSCCNEEWQDALEPNKEMKLACPHCGAINKVTWQFDLFVVGGGTQEINELKESPPVTEQPKRLQLYRMLLRLYSSRSPKTYNKDSLRKKEVLKAYIQLTQVAKLLVAGFACWLIFGNPLIPRHTSLLLTVLRLLSFAGAVVILSALLGSLRFHARRWTFTLLLHGCPSMKTLSVLRKAGTERNYRTESSPFSRKNLS